MNNVLFTLARCSNFTLSWPTKIELFGIDDFLKFSNIGGYLQLDEILRKCPRVLILIGMLIVFRSALYCKVAEWYWGLTPRSLNTVFKSPRKFNSITSSASKRFDDWPRVVLNGKKHNRSEEHHV